jgi:co-chaperonin GroES (HSP10)
MSSVLIPQGSRIIGVDIQPVTELEARAKGANLHIVIDEKNIPQPTSMIVHAVGPDPLVQEYVHVGDTVLFNRHAGTEVYLEGRKYRSLEYREVSHVIRQVAQAPVAEGGSSSDPAASPQQPHTPASQTE